MIIAGIVVGLLGKFVAPGSRDNTPLWLTILCGIVGVIIGYAWLGGTQGIDWMAFIVSVLIAAVLVMIASTVTGRNTTHKKKLI
ncbi:MAG TPA: GlsB/YeaQ/YmgE family stress response membrane protein [Marmoricola sp.]